MSGTTLVIPAWDEPEAIGPVLDEIPPQSVDRVIVVVGSPTDPTRAAAAGRGVAIGRGVDVLVQERRGYGAACWTGARAALQDGASSVAFLDGDYADPPAALPSVLEPIRLGRADLVLGWRDLREHPHALPAHARAGNAAVLLVMRALYASTFRDLPSFKAIRADTLRALQMREMTYGWTVEMLAKSARCGARIEQIPIAYRPRLGGRSKVAGSVRGSVGAATGLLSCALAYAAWRPAATHVRALAGGR